MNPEMDKSLRLLIVGASARAAAHSALRAGLRPVGCDLFADEDLRAVADVLPLEQYPYGLAAAAERAPDCPWMYTGALENHPEIVTRISRRRALLGNAAGALELVRDPFHVRDILHAADFPFCNVRSVDDTPLPDGRWLLKPFQSAGGARIQPWSELAKQEAMHETAFDENYFFQERAAGTPMSAVLLAMPDATWLIGVSRQLIGGDSANAGPFAYCGSIGPVSLTDSPWSQLERMGQAIADECGLRGLFGIDFMFDGKTPWLTEVNPRYTASVEVLEFALDISLLGWHCHACAAFDNSIPDLLPNHQFHTDGIAELSAQPPGQTVAKQIIYAGRECVVSSLAEFTAENAGARVPFLADIPAVGSIIPAGRPVCTVFATESDFESASQLLQQRVSRIESTLQTRDSR